MRYVAAIPFPLFASIFCGARFVCDISLHARLFPLGRLTIPELSCLGDNYRIANDIQLGGGRRSAGLCRRFVRLRPGRVADTLL
jgi:hypothetical protein